MTYDDGLLRNDAGEPLEELHHLGPVHPLDRPIVYDEIIITHAFTHRVRYGPDADHLSLWRLATGVDDALKKAAFYARLGYTVSAEPLPSGEVSS